MTWLTNIPGLAPPRDPHNEHEITRDLDEEIAFHLDRVANELEEAGAEHDLAATKAIERFGDIERIRRECLHIAREERLMLRSINVLLIVIVLLLGVVVVVQVRAAQRMRVRAEQERAMAVVAQDKAEAMSQFVQGVFTSTEPSPGVTVSDVLAEAEAKIETSFADQPEVAAHLQNVVHQARSKHRNLLDVPESIRAQYASLLEAPKTGLIRLMPRGAYETSIKVRGAGPYYSFHRLTHEYGFGSDIAHNGKELSVGFAGVDYGIFLELGDITANDLFTATATPPQWLPSGSGVAWGEIWEHRPSTKEPALRQAYRDYRKGVAFDEAELRSDIHIRDGESFLLRSINMDQSDLLVAARVVGVSREDGSVLLLWKILKTFQTPKLDR